MVEAGAHLPATFFEKADKPHIRKFQSQSPPGSRPVEPRLKTVST